MPNKFAEKKAMMKVCEELVESLMYQRTANTETIDRITANHNGDSQDYWDYYDQTTCEDAQRTIDAIDIIIKHLEKLI